MLLGGESREKKMKKDFIVVCRCISRFCRNLNLSSFLFLMCFVLEERKIIRGDEGIRRILMEPLNEKKINPTRKKSFALCIFQEFSVSRVLCNKCDKLCFF